MANLVALFALAVLAVSLSSSEGRVFGKCELAQQLLKHKVPRSQIGTWLCIAEHESHYDTTQINHSSGDHGIFQISEIYWCSADENPGKACKTTCSRFRDDNLADDISCIKRIYDEHQRLFGNGFHAWTVYPKYCTGDKSYYANGCI